MDQQESTQLAALDAFMRQTLAEDETGHDTGHIDRVIQLAEHILQSEPTADEFITLAAATLHDTYDDKLFDEVEQAKQRVANEMTRVGVSEVKQNAIFQIIDNMSWSKQRFGNPEPLDISGQIVQDADRLEAMGMIAVARVIQYGVQAHHILYDPAMPPRDLKTKEDYRNPAGETMINHFDEKLFLLKDYLNTDEAKRIGTIRDTAMHQFVDQFKAEWVGEDYQ